MAPVSALENAIQRAAAQHGEAQQIRATYQQIVRRLKGERVSFDQQVAALERTLAHKRHDLEQLQLLVAEAGRARDAAQQELVKRKAACEEEHAQREGALRDKQQLIQQRLRRRKEARSAAAAAAAAAVAAAATSKARGPDGASNGAQEGGTGSVVVVVEADGEQAGPGVPAEEDEGDREAEQQRLAESKQQLEALQTTLRRVKDVMGGVGTVEGVVEKMAAQAETLESLGTASRENLACIERLQEERDALRAAVERSRFAPKPTRSPEDVAAELARDQERLGELQLKHQQVAKLLKGSVSPCVGIGNE